MLKSLSTREKIVKIILCVLVVFACVTIFPKNFKIAIINYDGRQTNVVVRSANNKFETEEAGYIFGKGCFYNSSLLQGPVEVIEIEDDREFVDDVVAYYGSVKISKTFTITEDDGNLRADIEYNIPKMVFMIVLYTLLSLSLMTCGILAILKNKRQIILKKIEINLDKIDILIFIGVAFLYSVILFLVSRNQLIKWIYPLEIALSTVVFFSTMCIQKQMSGDRKRTLFSCAPIGLTLAMSINKICAFTFIDGHQAIMEQVDIAGDKLRHWEKNSARLNYIIMGTFERFNFIDKLKGETPAKLMHWFFGAILLLYIVWFISSKLIKSETGSQRAIKFAIVFCSVFLYNNTLCALKNYNYDLFSLTFGVIAFLHMLYATRTLDKRYAVSAVCFATLGTLEKMIDWPIMLLCMMGYVIISIKDEEKQVKRALIETLKMAGLTLVIAMCSNLYIQHIVRGDHFANYNIDNLFQPLQGQMYQFLTKIPGLLEAPETPLYILGNVIGWIAVYIGAMFCLWLPKHAEKHRNILLIGLRTITLAIIPMVIFVAYAGILYYRTAIDLLGTGSFAALVREIDTFGTITFIFILATLICWKKDSKHKELIFIMTLTGFYIPLAYAFLDKRLESRYFNVFGLITIICMLLIVLEKINFENELRVSLAIAAIFGITVSELWAFCPTNLYFMPYWNIGDKQSGNYFGAGSESMIAGEALLEMFAEQGEIPDDVIVYINYGGEWNSKPEGWEFKSFPSEDHKKLGNASIEDIEFGKHTYFAYTAAALERKRYPDYEIPDRVIPGIFDEAGVLEIKIRDTWVVDIYRADDLRDYFENVVFVEK